MHFDAIFVQNSYFSSTYVFLQDVSPRGELHMPTILLLLLKGEAQLSDLVTHLVDFDICLQNACDLGQNQDFVKE